MTLPPPLRSRNKRRMPENPKRIRLQRRDKLKSVSLLPNAAAAARKKSFQDFADLRLASVTWNSSIIMYTLIILHTPLLLHYFTHRYTHTT